MTFYETMPRLGISMLIITLAAACHPPSSKAPAEKADPEGGPRPTVVVSILPQRYFVERLAGDLVEIEVLAPPNHSPETHQVTPRQMETLARAKLYFRIGMPFEDPLVQRLQSNCPNLLIVDTRQGVPMLTMAAHSHEDGHDHGPTCAHGGEDPHIWLDPLRVKIQANGAAVHLSALLPEHQTTIQNNNTALAADLDALHQRLETILAPARGKTLYVFHPAFGYLADAYGFEQRAIEHEGKSPGTRRLYAIIEEMKTAGISAIFDQPQFASPDVRTVAEAVGAEVVLLDNLAYDYLENMERMARDIAAHLQ